MSGPLWVRFGDHRVEPPAGGAVAAFIPAHDGFADPPGAGVRAVGGPERVRAGGLRLALLALGALHANGRSGGAAGSEVVRAEQV